jgi:hypothetical protein
VVKGVSSRLDHSAATGFETGSRNRKGVNGATTPRAAEFHLDASPSLIALDNHRMRRLLQVPEVDDREGCVVIVHPEMPPTTHNQSIPRPQYYPAPGRDGSLHFPMSKSSTST